MFQKATKDASYLRLAISGPSGSGKTYTALSIALGLSDKVALIDTEHGSASKYADLFAFDVVNMPAPYHPDNFCTIIEEAVKGGYKVLIIDSLTHAWNGPGGIMEIVDKAVARSKSGNSYTAWAEATPIHQRLINKIVSSPIHIIVTMRSKTEYVLEKNEKTGKSTPRKVGMAPVQRDGMEYEFDVWMEMDIDNKGLIQKTRCPELNLAVIDKPGREMADTLAAWLNVKDLQAVVPAPQPSGDGQKGKPPETWGHKIEAANAFLDRFVNSSEDDWQGARTATLNKVKEWPEPHRQTVNDHADKIARERGEVTA